MTWPWALEATCHRCADKIYGDDCHDMRLQVAAHFANQHPAHGDQPIVTTPAQDANGGQDACPP